jgi:RNA polymerase sigma-70 factor (ECF subfamily)
LVEAQAKVLFSIQVRHCALELGQDGSRALERLYDLTAQRLVRYATTLTHNQHDAEDAMQAAVVRISTNPKGLMEAWHPWAYLLRIVHNEALKIMRRKRPFPLSPALSDVCGDGGAGQADSESKNSIQNALCKLPAAQSQVVVLKIWEEMTFLEIGEVLGLSPNTVASRYRYALQKLTQHLQPLANEVHHA